MVVEPKARVLNDVVEVNDVPAAIKKSDRNFLSPSKVKTTAIFCIHHVGCPLPWVLGVKAQRSARRADISQHAVPCKLRGHILDDSTRK